MALARAKRKVRDRLRTLDLLQGLGPPPSRIIIPLGENQSHSMQHCASQMKPRLRRWVRPAPNADITSTGTSVTMIHQGRYSRRCKHPKVDYQPRTRSFAVVTRKRLCWYIASQHQIWVAPKGWHFGADCCTGTGRPPLRVYACRDSFSNDRDFRWYFNSDDVYRGETAFWKRARLRVKAVKNERHDRREYDRIARTVITVELIVPHKGVRTTLRVQRTGPMRMRYARDFGR